MNTWRAGFVGLALCAVAGCVETTSSSPAGSVPAGSVTATSGGGADVRFSSGCWVTYDASANRGGHVGTCTNAEFASANQDADRFLGRSSSTASVASDDLSGFVGARAGQAEGGLLARGYQLARTEGLTAFWFNRSTGSYARIVTSQGRYSSVTMLPSGSC